MNKIIIFGGTTEGRLLSEYLSCASVRHVLSVTSDYGNMLITPNEYAEVMTGKMDLDAMLEFFKDRGFAAEDTVVDATHPYAVLASENIKAATLKTGCKLIRIVRRDKDIESLPDDGSKKKNVFFYDDPRSCFDTIDGTEGNILLTTGSKELDLYKELVSDKTLKRTYVRIIPSQESLKICERCGIEPSKIIAMQGPFGTALNKALIEQYSIDHLVTKQSGAAGGFNDKTEACLLADIDCHVIKKPVAEAGVSVSEAFYLITGEKLPCEKTKSTETVPDAVTGRRQIWLAGAGMGSTGALTEDVKEAIEEADAVFGALRLVESVRVISKYPVYRAEDIIAILTEHREYRRIVILFSGDSGFHSGAGSALNKLRVWDPEADIRVLPGISSISYMAAITGESYDDAVLFSLHGDNAPTRLHALTETVKYDRKTYVLLSGDEDVREIGSRLKTAVPACEIIVGRDLSYVTESLIRLTPEEAASFRSDGMLTALIINPGYERRPLIKAFNDKDFVRGNVPMTKECVRHECVVRLGLREGDTVYDIGGGTGSVALEAAALHPSLSVYTIEHDPEAAALIRLNIQKMQADNVFLIEGEAPDAMDGLRKPDAVFIGGSAGKLKDILSAVHQKGKGIRFVVTSVSLETAGELNSIIAEWGIENADIVQMQVSEVKTVGSHHMMNAQNPVMIYSFIR